MLVAASFFGGSILCILRCHSTDTHTHTTSQVLSLILMLRRLYSRRTARMQFLLPAKTRPIKDVAPTKNKGAKAYVRKSQAWGRLHWDQTKMYFMECETMPWPHESGQFRVKKSLKMFNRCLVKIMYSIYRLLGGFFFRMQAAHPWFLFWILFIFVGRCHWDEHPRAKSYTFVNFPNLFFLVVEEKPALH